MDRSNEDDCLEVSADGIVGAGAGIDCEYLEVVAGLACDAELEYGTLPETRLWDVGL